MCAWPCFQLFRCRSRSSRQSAAQSGSSSSRAQLPSTCLWFWPPGHIGMQRSGLSRDCLLPQACMMCIQCRMRNSVLNAASCAVPFVLLLLLEYARSVAPLGVDASDRPATCCIEGSQRSIYQISLHIPGFGILRFDTQACRSPLLSQMWQPRLSP